KFHKSFPSFLDVHASVALGGNWDGCSIVCGGLGDCIDKLHVVQALCQRGATRKAVFFGNPCDLFKECASLEHEAFVLAQANAWRVHGKTTAPIWVVRSERDGPVAGFLGSIGRGRWGEDVEFAGFAEIEKYRAFLTK